MIWTAAPKVMWVGRARTLALWLLAVLVAASIGVVPTAGPTLAATTITVTTTADDLDIGFNGNCTLREAILAANIDTKIDTCPAGSGKDTIIVPASATPYTLTNTGADEDDGVKGDLDLYDADGVVIRGAGAASTIIDAAGIDRVFHVSGSGTTSISGVTVKGGNTATSAGGILNSGTLTLNNSTVSDNTTSFNGNGGGIFNYGTLTLDNSTVSGNSTYDLAGGGIYNEEGTLTLNTSTVSSNQSSWGGGIFNHFGTLTLNTSTVSGNQAHWGGGIGSYTYLGSLQKTTITNSTISANTAYARGGGINNELGLTAIEHSTITNNTAPAGEGSGVASESPATSTEVLSSIISANTNTDVDFVNEATNSFVSKGFNLIGDGNATPAFNQTGDRPGVASPGLGPLANNGGPTLTHAVQPGSAAIDLVTSGCPPTDQRGETRPKDGDGNGTATCDIGAFEKTPPPNTPPVARANSYSVREDAILRVGPRGVLKNDSDANADPLSARKMTTTRHGTLTLRADGSLVYNSKPNFNRVDTFYYQAFDGKALSNQAKVTIRVRAVAG